MNNCAARARYWMRPEIAGATCRPRPPSCKLTRMHMAETCLNELGIEREALLADSSIAMVIGDELSAFETVVSRDAHQTRTMGPVNMMALEEYRETARAARVP